MLRRGSVSQAGANAQPLAHTVLTPRPVEDLVDVRQWGQAGWRWRRGRRRRRRICCGRHGLVSSAPGRVSRGAEQRGATPHLSVRGRDSAWWSSCSRERHRRKMACRLLSSPPTTPFAPPRSSSPANVVGQVHQDMPWRWAHTSLAAQGQKGAPRRGRKRRSRCVYAVSAPWARMLTV